jgi:histidinol-phosphate phosphatase family protein
MSNKTVFFDRDGTLIVDKIYLNDPDAIEYLPGAFESLRRLRDAGFQMIVVTNQSGIARGLVTLKNLDEIHRRMAHEFARHGVFFKGFYYAPYSVESNHFMRKPNPGMLLTAASDYRVDLDRSWMVGDRATDVEAGHRAGCRSLLLEGLESEETIAKIRPTAIVPGLSEVADFIIAHDAAPTLATNTY